MFELDFSKANNTSIHSITLAKNITEINQITLLKNNNGFYAAIKILSIKDDTRRADWDEVSVEYFIQSNVSLSFLILPLNEKRKIQTIKLFGYKVQKTVFIVKLYSTF